MESYAGMKGNEIINDIYKKMKRTRTLSKVNQFQKYGYLVFSLMCATLY